MRIIALEEHFAAPNLISRIDNAAIVARGWSSHSQQPTEMGKDEDLQEVEERLPLRRITLLGKRGLRGFRRARVEANIRSILSTTRPEAALHYLRNDQRSLLLVPHQ